MRGLNCNHLVQEQFCCELSRLIAVFFSFVRRVNRNKIDNVITSIHRDNDRIAIYNPCAFSFKDMRWC